MKNLNGKKNLEKKKESKLFRKTFDSYNQKEEKKKFELENE